MPKLSDLLANIYSLPSELDRDVTGLTQDSRMVKEGDLFCACKGTQSDGREFISDAITKGATAVFAESDSDEVSFLKNIPVIPVKNLSHQLNAIASVFYGNPTQGLRIIGVTGTNGKTSCTYFIAEALRQLNISCGIIGTLGSGFVGNMQPGKLTTPDTISLQATFARLKEQGASAIAMEVSSHAIDQGRAEGIAFEVVIFTNLTRDHLDYHGDMETYGNVKKRLLESPQAAHVVINADDPFGETLIPLLKADKDIYAYSLNPSIRNDVRVISATHIKSDLQGFHAQVITPWGQGELHLALMGQFNLSNALAVVTALCLFKIPLEKILPTIAHLKSVPGRMEVITGSAKAPLVVVDYAHKPDALEKVLIALRNHVPGKLYCIFGCGGERDKGKRPMMAAIAERIADFVIVTDDNPRHEDAARIVEDIFQGFLQPERVIVQHDRSKAIQDIIQCAEAGDGILVAGRGGEQYQLIGDVKIPMDDGEIVRQSLAQ
jgi:UDP-N-acetylmuramoyl-L-alanyl-D-glutamate--2,6-diaminopimelate ligase